MGGQIIGKYLSNHFPVECVCIHGHTCYPRPSSVQQGQGMCNQCRQTRGELMIQQACSALNLSVIYQAKHSDLRNLRLDYAVEYGGKIRYIEFDGLQHFEFIPFFYKSMDAFNEARTRDVLKTSIANESTQVIRLDYTWASKPLGDWIKFISQALNSPESIIYSDEVKYLWLKNRLSELHLRRMEEDAMRSKLPDGPV